MTGHDGSGLPWAQPDADILGDIRAIHDANPPPWPFIAATTCEHGTFLICPVCGRDRLEDEMSAQIITALRKRADLLDRAATSDDGPSDTVPASTLKMLAHEFRMLADEAEAG